MSTLKQLVKMAVPVSRSRYDRQREEIERLTSRLSALEAKYDEEVPKFISRLELSMLRNRILPASLAAATNLTSLIPLADYTLHACFEKLQALAPAAFAVWRRLLEVNAEAYEGFPVDSCSVVGHPLAEFFCEYLRSYLVGSVLDIGCGPQPVPRYLLEYPVERIAGIDPLGAPVPHPFVFVQGAAEFLPWPDGTFDTVVASTSLDHVLLPDRVMQEICRVLKPGGHFVTWVSFMAGAKPYDPYSTNVEAIDKFHLFHFDGPTFEALMSEYFVTRERYFADQQSSFWSFQVKPGRLER